MPSYLRLEVGPYFLLIPTDEVFEVLAFAAKPGEEGFAVWRDEILPAVSMRSRLGLPPEDRSGVMIVHGGLGQGREGLIVDKVMGLVELQDMDFRPLPVSGPVCRHFDKVWTERYSGRQALRVRAFNQGRDPCVDTALTV